MVAGTPPIRAKKARYYEDARFKERILPPPALETAQQPRRPDDWSRLPLPPRPEMPSRRPRDSRDDEDPTEIGTPACSPTHCRVKAGREEGADRQRVRDRSRRATMEDDAAHVSDDQRMRRGRAPGLARSRRRHGAVSAMNDEAPEKTTPLGLSRPRRHEEPCRLCRAARSFPFADRRGRDRVLPVARRRRAAGGRVTKRLDQLDRRMTADGARCRHRRRDAGGVHPLLADDQPAIAGACAQAARAKAGERYEAFVTALGRRFAKGPKLRQEMRDAE
jgi:hypothetical protein